MSAFGRSAKLFFIILNEVKALKLLIGRFVAEFIVSKTSGLGMTSLFLFRFVTRP